jgi:hypothetical protein
MIPFNPTQFKVDFPQFISYTDTSLYNWYSEGVNGVGVPILALCSSLFPKLVWNAATNMPALTNGTVGPDYICTIPGSANFGAGPIPFTINQIVSYNMDFNIWTNVGYPIWYFFSCQILAHLLTIDTNGIVGIMNSGHTGTVEIGLEVGTYNWWKQSTYGIKCYELLNRRGGFTTYSTPDYNGLYL